eukprot:CAMPEP_0114485680 /NCGR_PEP_ID=MMETSP0104-20121206/20077_1 /TAXON_ID=37642 ORGANISM="Paraphysomonas imperforata, Strain PA2" /NCGR_SAMPLE_ID=MMETSP0104 /ASSEMBLY_ACC=CAM_ASM_000202 /LENGTH=191 /DNA_ID=CAMNT_0001661813 /DNA_START=398 /DNA_END=973 /DNA_ORIENTATION=+
MDNYDSNARHCYYLYYERKSDGHMKQQVFCRGTTLFADVITNLKAAYVYDDELDCYIHMGFRDHANLLLADLEPLLTEPSNPRATVEMCGHSLGGVAAMIVAMKLRKRGHKVTRLTTFGSPRMCTNGSVEGLLSLLPPDTLRVEDENSCRWEQDPWATNCGCSPDEKTSSMALNLSSLLVKIYSSERIVTG